MDMRQMMKQAQKMQRDLAAAQEELKELETAGTAGGGVVEVHIGGDLQVKQVLIDPSAVDPADVEMLQDLICVAVNDAISNAQALANDKVGSVTGGMNIPGLM